MGNFTIKDGLSIKFGTNEASFSFGTVDPLVSGVSAPLGSMYKNTSDNVIYVKTGALNTDWKPYSEIEGGGLLPEIISGATTAEAGKLYGLDTSTAGFTVTLPAAPELGDRVGFFDCSNTLDTDPVTVSRNSLLINGISEDIVIDLNNCYFEFIYGVAGTGWMLSNTDESGNISMITQYLGSDDNTNSAIPEYIIHTALNAVNFITEGGSIEESIAILDEVVTDISNYVGMPLNSDELPAYSSNNYITNDDTLVSAIGALDTELASVSAIASAGISWREFIKAATIDGRLNGDIASIVSDGHFSDDDVPYWDFSSAVVGDKVVYIGNDASILGHVFEWNGTTWVDAVETLTANEAVAVHFDFPDTPGSQEDGAAYKMNQAGDDIIKLADFDLESAATIGISSGYTPGSGDVTLADSVESAIQKLDGNIDNNNLVLGVPQGSLNLGNTGYGTVADNANVLGAIGSLDTAVGNLETAVSSNDDELDNLRTFVGSDSGSDVSPAYSEENVVANGDSLETAVDKLDTALGNLETVLEGAIATVSDLTIDTIPLASILTYGVSIIEWIVLVSSESSTNGKIATRITALISGTEVDMTEYSILDVGDNFRADYEVVSDGTDIVLNVTSNGTGGHYKCIRKTLM